MSDEKVWRALAVPAASDDGAARGAERGSLSGIQAAAAVAAAPAGAIGGTDGNDTISLPRGAAARSLSIDLGAGIDTVLVNDGDAILSRLADDALENVERLTLAADKASNIDLSNQSEGFEITGGSKRDTIVGGKGDDRIVGGGQSDTLTGGDGKDTFVLLQASDSTLRRSDTITDFEEGKDVIDISALKSNGAFTWGGQTPTAGGVWYVAQRGSTLVYIDTDGNAATAESVITLKGRVTLSASDFVLSGNAGPEGSVVITGDAKQFATLQADASGLTDGDGLGTFSYQWTADDVAISGATGSSYVLQAADVGKQIRVVVSYTDGAGNPESVTSAATDEVEAGPAPVFELSALDGANGFRLSGVAASDYSGSVSSAGDVNGDGFDDLLIGAPGADVNSSGSGASYLVFGAASGFASNLDLSALNGSNGFKLSGVAASDFSGRTVSSAGDVNGDGYADLIIAAFAADPNGPYSGASYVVFGKASGFGSNLDLSALNGSNGFKLSGVAASDFSGRSVSSAGDVNGDGYDDVLVGTFGAPSGTGFGTTYVVFGASGGFASNLQLSDLNGANGFSLRGVASSDYSGASVSSAGDVNGDGFDDLLIGASGADANSIGSGASYVVFGQASGFASSVNLSTLDGNNGFKLSGVASYDYSGGSVSSAGDVNGDGYADLLIGAFAADANDAGAGYVVFGAASGFASNLNLSALDGINGFKLSGVAPLARTGFSVSSAGDVNGDGYADVLVGAFNAGSAGASYVVFGAASGFASNLNLSALDGANGYKLNGVAKDDSSGGSVSEAGDVNGDGYDDLLVGATSADPNGERSGASYLVFGTATVGGVIDTFGTSGSNTQTLTADQSGLDGGAGDDVLTGNATANVLIGGLGNDTLDGAAGNDVLIGGAGNDVLVLDAADTLRVDGGAGRDTLKLNGSGVSLNLTTLNNFSDAAQAPVNPYSNIEIIDLTGSGNNSLALSKIDLLNLVGAASGTDAARDNNLLRVDGNAGDSISTTDVWIELGAADGNGTLSESGGYVLYENGSASLLVDRDIDRSSIALPPPPSPISDLALSALNGSNGFRLIGAAARDESGFAVSSAGDVNGDGYDDMLVGAFGAPMGARTGASYVVFGQASGFAPSLNLSAVNGTNGFKLIGFTVGERSGYSVSSAGDVNGDGLDDLIIGASEAAPNGSRSGASYVVFGKASGFGAELGLSTLNGSNGFKLSGVAASDRSGTSVSSAGDINGDGYDDLIIGAVSLDPSGVRAGTSYVVFGAASGFAFNLDLSALNGANGFKISGEASRDYSGRSVSSAGDVNGDGYDDLIIGAYRADPNGNQSGASYVVFGQASGFASNLNLSALNGVNGFKLSGVATSDYSGRSVSSAGDVNGDGYDDLIIGAYEADSDAEDSGASYVVFGKGSGFASNLNLSALDGSNGFKLSGGAKFDESGYSVSSAGDVNGDGFDDLIIGAVGASAGAPYSGASYVVFGKAGVFASNLNLSALDASNGYKLSGVGAYERISNSVSSAGDINGDGYDDLIVGGSEASPNGRLSGESYVIFGAATADGVIDSFGTSGNNTRTLAAGKTGLDGGAGDDVLTGNAAANVLIGGLGNDTLDGAAGNDVLIGGAGNDVLVLDAADTLRVDGGAGRDTLKLNGSGVSLNLTALNNFSDAAQAPVNPYSNIEIIDLTGTGNNSLALSKIDLLNLVGAASGTDAARDNNLLRVDGNAGDSISTSDAWIELGAADGDGALSAGGSYVLYQSGSARLLVDSDVDRSGIFLPPPPPPSPISDLALSALDGSNGFRLNGAASFDKSGGAVSSAGDVNGDGYDDVLVGASGAPNGARTGASYVVFGAASGFAPSLNLSALNGTGGFKLSGVAGLDYSGRSVSSLGDVNGDGFDDLIIGASGADPNGNYSGASYVVFGKANGFAANLDLAGLTGTNGFRLSGVAAGDLSGASVSSAGDVNGDGFDDLIIGARDAAPNGLKQAGISYVVFGNAGGFASNLNLATLTGTNGFRLSGAAKYDNSGGSVSSAGDVNGDGLDDLIVGAGGADANGDNAGASYVVFGKASGFASNLNLAALNGTDGFKLSGATAGDRSGFSVSSAGDVDGDGFDDLIVGADRADPNGNYAAGASYVVFGQAGAFAAELVLSALDGSNGFKLSGSAASNASGTSVSSAGDVNGDGFDDLIVGAPYARANSLGRAGVSYVVFGQASGFDAELNLGDLDGSNGFKLSGEFSYGYSGASVSAAGDINGDGYDDLMTGANRASPNSVSVSGASYVVYGFATLGGPINSFGTAGSDTLALAAGKTGLDGGAGDDVLTGNAADNVLIGGLGNDTLDGAAGNDVLIGAAGNDVLIYDAADTLRVDGGSGTDTLRLINGDSIDFADLNDSLITGIEKIDLQTDAAANTLTIYLRDALALSDSTNDLYVLGDAGDVVNLGAGIVSSGTPNSMVDGVSYALYVVANTDLRLFVDADIIINTFS